MIKKLLCVCNEGVEGQLEVGRIYEINATDCIALNNGTFYQVKDERGMYVFYHQSRFKEIKNEYEVSLI